MARSRRFESLTRALHRGRAASLPQRPAELARQQQEPGDEGDRGRGAGRAAGVAGQLRRTAASPGDRSAAPDSWLLTSHTARRRGFCLGDPSAAAPSFSSLPRPQVKNAQRLACRNKPAFSVAAGPPNTPRRTTPEVLGSFPTLLVLMLFSFPCLRRSRPREPCLKSSRLLKAAK